MYCIHLSAGKAMYKINKMKQPGLVAIWLQWQSKLYNPNYNEEI